MSVNDEADLKGITEAALVAKHLREVLRDQCRPGTTTADLDELCRRELRALGATSAPRQDYQAPCYAFYSVNSAVVHGLPSRNELRVGDLVKIDVTPRYRGFVADTACSVVLGDPTPRSLAAGSVASRLVTSVERSFHKGLAECRVGAFVHHIGRAVEATTRADGFFVVPDLSGHGVGRAIHEDPTVANTFEPGRARLTEGLVIAIEPMISHRKSALRTKADRWTLSVAEGTLAAHYEHTVLITRTGPVVLTA